MGYLPKKKRGVVSKAVFWNNPTKMKLLSPIFFFHGRQLELGRIKADHFQVDSAVRANHNLTFDDIDEDQFGITFGAVGSNCCSHFYSSPLAEKRLIL
jgi:hypothetical protein